MRRARRWFPSLSEADLEDLYQGAWLSVVRTQSEVRDLDSYLYEAVHSQGLMELRRRRRRPTVPLDPSAKGRADGGREGGIERLVDETTSLPEEVAETRALAATVADLLAELSPRQRLIVKARWGWGLSREETAALAGTSQRTVKRELARLAPRLAENARAVESGEWCARKRSLITAYAIGLLSERRAERANQHLRGCPACRALVHELRHRADEVAALLPVPSVLELPGPGPLARLGELADAPRSELADLVTSAKQHATTLALRGTDPTPLAAARPGTVAATLMGCVAFAGGTYCAVEGVPGSLGLTLKADRSEDGPRRARPEARPVQAEQSPVPPVSVQAPDPAVGGTPPAQPPPVDQAPTDPVPPPPEFFTQRDQATAAPADSQQPRESSELQPAPASDPGEFGGP